MGSRGSKPTLSITTAGEKYQAGTIVSGEIIVVLKSESMLDKLKLRLKVREKMRMEPFPLCGIAESQAFYRASYSIQVPSFNTGMRKEGVHRFPFHFQISPNFPSSFLYSESTKMCRYTYLRYILVARLRQLGLKSKQNLQVYQVTPVLEIPYEVKERVNCEVCGEEEEIKLQIVMEKSGYAPGAIIPIAVLIEPREIREFRLKLRLYRNLSVSSGAIAFNALDKVGNSQRINRTLVPCEPVVLHLSMPLPSCGKTCSCPTLQSRFIKCDYFFLLEVLARGACGVVRHSTKVPIDVYDISCN